jgi:enoyl-CoA hydratase
MSYNLIIFEAPGDGIALVTINRPEKLNALDDALMGELDDAFGRAAGDPAVRGLLLTGAGEKAFVAGADIKELPIGDAAVARAFALRGQAVFERLARMPKPSVAAINGFALGGGLELALAATLRVAAGHAKLGFPEIKLGIMPGYGGTVRLPRLIGRGRALEMLLAGEAVDAREALSIGLVDHVSPQAELAEFSRGILLKMLANAPLATAAILEAVNTGVGSACEEALRREAELFGALAASEDAREGTRAFLKKRTPVFKGR